VALIWLGAFAAILAARMGIAAQADHFRVKLFACVLPAHVALVASWWVLRDRTHATRAALPRVVRAAAWVARALAWITVVHLGIVVLVLVLDPPLRLSMIHLTAELDGPAAVDVQLRHFTWTQSESGVLASAATLAPVLGGFRAKQLLQGGPVRPLRRAAGLAALAYAVVVLVMSPKAWRDVDVQQWIADVGYLLGGYLAPVATEAWHYRAAAVVASGAGLVIALAVFFALGRAARDEADASGLSGAIATPSGSADGDDVAIGGIDVE
jgi:hypothetical protein